MSYQVLARKWRPRTFRELVGQQHVLQALVNALDHNRLHHAYLFTGTRGVGKTTIARILAKCLNCETGVSSEPCGQCSSCCEINEGRFVDLIEVDAASRTKVEDTRELLENVQYAPTRGRYKVYLIDEVHMLSTHSFNALLKTLEEPPPHVKFLLATTDPQKLPVTILSRCLQFHLKNMEPERIVGHLKFVLEQEMVPFEESALWQLGRAADGSMRDAMSLTDQAIAFGSGKVADDDVSVMLGTIDQHLVFSVLEALVSGDGQVILQSVDKLSQFAPDYAAALADILSALHRVAIAQALPEAVDNSRGDREQILALASQLPAEDVQLFYQTALMGRRDLPLSPDPRAGFEMVLLRMLAFRPQGVHTVPTQALTGALTDGSQPAESAAKPTDDYQSESTEPVPAQSAGAVQPGSAGAVPSLSSETQPPEPTETFQSQPAQAVSPPRSEPAPVQYDEPVTPKHVEASHSAEPLSSASSAYEEAMRSMEPAPQGVETPALASEPQHEHVAQNSEPQKSESQSATGGAHQSDNARGLNSDELASMGLKSARTLPAPQPKVQSAFTPVPFAELTPDRWIEVYAGLGVGGVLQSTVSNCVLMAAEGDTLMFVLDERYSTLYDTSHQQRLADLLSQYFQRSLSVVIELGHIQVETPAAWATRIKKEQHEGAVQALYADPLVQQLLQQFEGVLEESSVEAIQNNQET